MEGESDEQRQRFLVELEFVQCLANPLYIDWLATQVHHAARCSKECESFVPRMRLPMTHGLQESIPVHTHACEKPRWRESISSFEMGAGCFVGTQASMHRRHVLIFFVCGMQGYLIDGKFIRYLDYLQYWKQPQYSKFIVYPHCLHFLGLLQDEDIRKLLTENRTFAIKLHDQQFYHWLYRRRHTHIVEPAQPASAQH